MIPPRTVASRWLWLAAGLLLVLEFLVFDRMTSRYHAALLPALDRPGSST